MGVKGSWAEVFGVILPRWWCTKRPKAECTYFREKLKLDGLLWIACKLVCKCRNCENDEAESETRRIKHSPVLWVIFWTAHSSEKELAFAGSSRWSWVYSEGCDRGGLLRGTGGRVIHSQGIITWNFFRQLAKPRLGHIRQCTVTQRHVGSTFPMELLPVVRKEERNTVTLELRSVTPAEVNLKTGNILH